MLINGLHFFYIIFLIFKLVLSIEYLNKYGSIEIECSDDNLLIFDSSSFPIPSTIYFKFSTNKNSLFDKNISYEYDILLINNNINKNINNFNDIIEAKSTINITADNTSYNYSDNNNDNISDNTLNENYKLRYITFPSDESHEIINNVDNIINYYNIPKNKEKIGNKFGNNLIISFHCEGLLKIENIEKDSASSLSTGVIIGIVFGALIAIIIIIIIVYCYIKKNLEKPDSDKKKEKTKIKNNQKKSAINARGKSRSITNNFVSNSGIATNKDQFLLKRKSKKFSIPNITSDSAFRIKKIKKKY